MSRQNNGHSALDGAESGRAAPGMRRRLVKLSVAASAALGVAVTAALVLQPASAQENPYERGPDPTVESVAAESGTFETEEVAVESGNGFNGGVIYYPTDTSQGTFAAVAAVPGFTASWADEGAWMGHWLASFGFVVIGIDTNTPNDWDTARGDQLLAALDYLTQQSEVADRVDPERLGVIGHSMGGGGAIYAAEQRPSLKAAVPLAPYSASQDLSTLQVPTMIMGAQDDGTVTPDYLDGLYATMPAETESAFVELSSGGHGFPVWGNSEVTRRMIPWLKIWLDNDTRYTQFLCPELVDSTGVSRYSNTCPYEPGGTPGEPTDEPTDDPTDEPTDEPTGEPTDPPTDEPTDGPTDEPTDPPTDDPTDEPTDEPTDDPTDPPTDDPTDEPTGEPTDEPTGEPTDEPTGEPTDDPTDQP